MKQIGQILLEQQKLNAEQLAQTLDKQREQADQRLGQLLEADEVVSHEDILRALAEQWGLEFAERIETECVDLQLTRLLPLEFLKAHHLVPVRRDGKLAVAMSDPLDVEAFDSVLKLTKGRCTRVIATESAIEECLSHCFYESGHAEDAADSRADEIDPAETIEAESEDLLNIAATAPAIKLVNAFFFQAVKSRASDIHIEPYEYEVKVRFRIDGVLHNRFSLPREHIAPLVSRLKIMANLNIAEKRLPQDGRTRIRIGDREIDVRVSTIPTSGGERVVLRLLDKATARFGMSDLGFSQETAERFTELIRRPHGIILLTGPTGSGKTTTLYSALTELNTEQRNILTVEDPIEYDLPGVGQMQVRPKINLTFANSLRHILRQDPDVIMVGEIRDPETAEIAIQAALTGHLVLSTLHTNDAASAITRLIEMGVEPYLVASSLAGIMAQRLVRVICPHCKQPAEDVSPTSWHGTGCPECMHTGYYGRSAIVELLTVDDKIRELTMAHSGAGEIMRAGIANGMKLLRDDGLRKVSEGVTTLEEVLRVTQSDAASCDIKESA